MKTTTVDTTLKMLAADALIDRQVKAVWWVGDWKLSMRLSGDVFLDITTEGIRIFKQYDGHEESVTCVGLKPLPEECKPKREEG